MWVSVLWEHLEIEDSSRPLTSSSSNSNCCVFWLLGRSLSVGAIGTDMQVAVMTSVVGECTTYEIEHDVQVSGMAICLHVETGSWYVRDCGVYKMVFYWRLLYTNRQCGVAPRCRIVLPLSPHVRMKTML